MLFCVWAPGRRTQRRLKYSLMKERNHSAMQSETIPLLVIVLCVILSAYFSATETAFSSLSRIKLKSLADKGDKRAGLVLRLAENYDALLSTILIGNNIVNIASASLATVLFVRFLGEENGPGVSTLVTTVVVLIFGEVSPKSIAKESPERFAMFSAPLLRGFIFCLTPVNFLFRQWKKLLSLVFKPAGNGAITEEELLTFVEEVQQGGGIDEQEGALIRSAIEFSERRADEIMTPRPDVVGVPAAAAKEEIAAVFAKTGFSRLPVYSGSLDHISGVICQKDFHHTVYHTDAAVADIVRPVLFCPENQRIGRLLKNLQKGKLHLAVVVDEFGGTCGIVTLEDVLEELVGEIWDEHDQVVQQIAQTAPGEYTVLGSAHVADLFALLGRERQFSMVTVSGWIVETLGSLPAQGDTFEAHGLRVTVLSTLGRRVEKARVEVLEKTKAEQ